MKMSGIISMAALALATPAIAREPAIHPAVTTDPAPDAANPARMDAFVIPSGEGAMNAVMYVAAGSGVHPTLLLLHGFPGNEQNLDLAQAARRAGWNVLTLHYRGSWGSPGIFSFINAAEDAFNALLFLEEASTVAKYRIDTSAIVVAGHSMGGFMAAEAAAAEPRVAGLFLIDPWDPAQTVAALATPQGEAGWKAEVAGDLPPLAGASYESLTAEIKGDTQRFDLGRKLVGYGRRPLTIIGAERGIGAMARKVGADAQSANPNTRLMVWPTDHSFSDKRIALADALVRFLAGVAPTLR
ncbi:MAG: alpha/beta fold hydrolase [Pseudomonadota bacterium]|jgi:pimeloyl-ACP methyl ester carboxylesterase|uniref:alpha/beta hydrolase family protein n=1 Tax=Sphingobium yanoikuyae TaxID=13690 RepID=UPI001377EDDA|nr:alpha/beta fold hydrolase [Sphingobium yanoikuyae]NBB38965.1 alpha/beta fold hydrolase [Sphingobium yanoikuyae]